MTRRWNRRPTTTGRRQMSDVPIQQQPTHEQTSFLDAQGEVVDVLPPRGPIPAGAYAGVALVEESTPVLIRAKLRSEIERLAARGLPFTSDDLEVADVRGNEIGAAFNSAHRVKIIQPTGGAVQSVRPSANARLIRVWAADPEWLARGTK